MLWYLLLPLMVQPAHPNFLVIILDDVGTDKLACYGESCQFPPTPNICAFADNGLKYTRAYAAPYCTPTRSMYQTGRYPHHTGLGVIIGANHPFDYDLALSEVTLAEKLPRYHSYHSGKWHMSTQLDGGANGPNLQGWDFFDGTMFNLNNYSYYSWPRNLNGMVTTETEYATVVQTDVAISILDTAPTPFVLTLAYSAPHSPWHYPPSDLHTRSLTGDPDDNPPLFYDAALEAADTELGVLLPHVPPNTYVFLFGDNGTPGEARDGCSPFPASKGTVYEGGIRVPFIVQGPNVKPGVCDSLVNVPLDTHGTIVGLSRFTANPSYGVNLKPTFTDHSAVVRDMILEETFTPNGHGPFVGFDRVVLDQRWALVKHLNQPDEFYDLSLDPYEGDNLLLGMLTTEQAAAYLSLYQAEQTWP